MSDAEVVEHHALRYERRRKGLPESPTVSCDLESESEVVPRNLLEGFDDEGNELADETAERYSVWRERQQKWKSHWSEGAGAAEAKPKVKVKPSLKPHNLTDVEYEI
jgi:hypothetical protein